jgi:hydrogenase nickel incorporation protein HypA/HybF
MHELAIAESVLAIVERHAAGRRVVEVQVRVGHLRQVVPSALEFAFELAGRGTVAEGATLVLEQVAAAGRCRACGERTTFAAFPFVCEACGEWDIELTQGQELQVEALELEEALTTNRGVTHGG